MLKTRVAQGYCFRHLSAQACPYANICEQCDNFTTSSRFLPQLRAQFADEDALREDAEARGWTAKSPAPPASSPACITSTDSNVNPTQPLRLDPGVRAGNRARVPELRQLPTPATPAQRCGLADSQHDATPRPALTLGCVEPIM